MRPQFLLDASVSLLNRTGAHYLAEELCRAFAGSDDVIVRRWRLIGKRLPPSFARRVMGRLMLKELGLLSDLPELPWPEPRTPALRRVFLDPLYVLRSRLVHTDIVLCHDIGPITHPELYDVGTASLYRAAYAKLAAARPGMVFVSDTSRRIFESQYGCDYRFRRVIPPMVRTSIDSGDIEPVPGIAKPFFLTVGALERRKNQVTAIRGFGRSGLHAAGYQYVLCGSRGVGATEIDELVEQTPGVQQLGYVTDPQLRWLYREASAFVLPSLLEGFGMPALEAAKHGLVPILSRDSALIEAVGAHGLAVDPHSPEEIAAAMKQVAFLDADARAAWSRALIEHAARATGDTFVSAWKQLLVSEGCPPIPDENPIHTRAVLTSPRCAQGPVDR